MAARPRRTQQPNAPSARGVGLPRISKGRRPEFYEDPAIDQLFAIITAITGELSVIYDRVDTLERLLVRARTVAADDLESFIASGDVAEVRVRHRDELLRRVFAVLEVYAERHTATPQ